MKYIQFQYFSNSENVYITLEVSSGDAKFCFYKWEHPILTVNYSVNNCSHKFDASE